MLRRICLVGVRGVGKTTLLDEVLPSRPAFEHVVGSRVLRGLVGPEFVRFDEFPEERKVHFRVEAIRWMERHQATTGRHILCDGHTTLLAASGQVEQVFTEHDCRFFAELILLEAPAEVIAERRRLDTRKVRRRVSLDTLRAELQGERSCCEALAQRWGMSLHRLPEADPAAALLELLA